MRLWTGFRRAAVAALVLVAPACDTGDGTTLQPPAADAAAVQPVPIGTSDPSPADEIVADTLASVPIEQPVQDVTVDPDAPTLPAPLPSDALTVTAPWTDGAPIAPLYGCDGRNVTPPLAWTGVPAGAVELAVALVDDSDLSRGQPFVHWVVTGLDPASSGLAENESPPEAVQALNFFGNVAYDGPCPPLDSTHVYTLTLFALAEPAGLPEGTPAAEVLDRLRDIIVDEATITGSSTR